MSDLMLKRLCGQLLDGVDIGTTMRHAAEEIERLRGLIALAITPIESYGNIEFAAVLRAALAPTGVKP